MMLTKDSPENLIRKRRYLYTLANGEVREGIFRKLTVDYGRLVLVFSLFGVEDRVRWCDIQGVQGEA